MDYLKIYGQFIADRLKKQPPKKRSKDNYYEIHHIDPRCMWPRGPDGKLLPGLNAASNLVRLIPEDHLFAHLLLVKAFPKEPKLVAALLIMLGKADISNRWTCSRKLYGLAKRIAYPRMLGALNPKYDARIHTFVHQSGKIRSCRQLELLSDESYVTRKGISGLITGVTKTHAGWALQEVTAQPDFEWPVTGGVYGRSKLDQTVHEWRHKDGTLRSATAAIMAKHIGCSRRATDDVVSGVTQQVHDWYLTKRHESYEAVIEYLRSARSKGAKTRKKRASKIYVSLVKPGYLTFRGNGTEFRAQFYPNERPDKNGQYLSMDGFLCIARNPKATWDGWRLAA